MRRCIIVLGILVAMCFHLAAQDESCSSVMRSPAASITFLEAQRFRRQSSCISTVIKHLGQVHEVAAAHVLASYLDFVDPATLPPPGGTAYVRPDYPAISALFEIGKPATSELISAIEGSDSQTIRQNASNTFMFVYRDDLAAGIRQLKKEQQAAKSADTRHRLNEALEMMLEACNSRSEQEARACKDVT